MSITIDFSKWSPLTVLACVVIGVVVVGGAVNTIVGNESFSGYLDDLKTLGTFVGGGVALGRGVHYAGREIGGRPATGPKARRVE